MLRNNVKELPCPFPILAKQRQGELEAAYDWEVSQDSNLRKGETEARILAWSLQCGKTTPLKRTFNEIQEAIFRNLISLIPCVSLNL